MTTSYDSCEFFRERASALFDGECAADDTLMRHLAACPACGRFARNLPELSGRSRALRRTAPPVDLWRRIEMRAGASALPGPSRWPARAAAALIGFLSIAGAGLVLRRPSHDTSSPQAAPFVRPFELLASQAERRGAPLPRTAEDRLLRSVLNRMETDR